MADVWLSNSCSEVNTETTWTALKYRPSAQARWLVFTLIISIWFCSCLCKVCSRFRSFTLRTLSLTALPQTVRLFIAFSGSPKAVNHPLHALQYNTVSIPFWTTRKRHSQTSKFDEKATPRAQAESLDYTLLLRTCYGEYIAHEKNGLLSHSNVSL